MDVRRIAKGFPTLSMTACRDVPIVLRASTLEYVHPKTLEFVSVVSAAASSTPTARLFAIGCWAQPRLALGNGAVGIGLGGRHVRSSQSFDPVLSLARPYRHTPILARSELVRDRAAQLQFGVALATPVEPARSRPPRAATAHMGRRGCAHGRGPARNPPRLHASRAQWSKLHSFRHGSRRGACKRCGPAGMRLLQCH